MKKTLTEIMAKPQFKISYDLSKLTTNLEELNLTELKRNGEEPDTPLEWKTSEQLLPYSSPEDPEECEYDEYEMEYCNSYGPDNASWVAEPDNTPSLPGYTTQARWFGPNVTPEAKPIILEELANILEKIGIKLISAPPSADTSYYLLYPNVHMHLMAPGVADGNRPLHDSVVRGAKTNDPIDLAEDPPDFKEALDTPSEEQRSRPRPELDDSDVRALMWASGIKVQDKKTKKNLTLKPSSLGWTIDDWLSTNLGRFSSADEIFRKMLSKAPNKKLLMYKYMPTGILWASI